MPLLEEALGLGFRYSPILSKFSRNQIRLRCASWIHCLTFSFPLSSNLFTWVRNCIRVSSMHGMVAGGQGKEGWGAGT